MFIFLAAVSRGFQVNSHRQFFSCFKCILFKKLLQHMGKLGFRLDLFLIFVNLVYYCFSNLFIAVVHMVGIVFGKYSQKYRSEISSEIIIFLYCMLPKEFTCRNKLNYSFCVALLLVFFQSKVNWFYIYKYIGLFIYVQSPKRTVLQQTFENC